ncbi:signal recognition particle protein [Candidatus Ichthyocystis hellenicum]|uniref:signal recognition particle protein n=1 Tax=Candidatus Ichthyocystis hellenicum TaxID=1561003 RepID=UPI000B007ABB|nr:signal recognition particle protein [Candidatus Ichthyocystis hellenicum]
MFDQLISRFHEIHKTLSGQAKISEKNIEDALREVRVALVDADVSLVTLKKFIDSVKIKSVGQRVIASLTPAQAFIGIVHKELTELFGSAKSELNLNAPPPATILLTGLQGSGKTTTTGKLAKFIQDTSKKKVLISSGDVYRPAAIDQLRILAEQLSVDFYESSEKSPQKIAKSVLSHANKKSYDLILFDTAGRTSVDKPMLKELSELEGILSPVETFIVIDSMLGQDAVSTSLAFKEAVKITGAIITKLDGDTRGGAALSVWDTVGVPIKFCGTSEKLDGLEEFYPERMASRILGMGDVVSLVEYARKAEKSRVEEKNAPKKSKKKFDMTDFRAQLEQIRTISSVPGFIDKLPKEISSIAAQQIPQTAKTVKISLGIIDSMTAKERKTPEILKASRKRRIASGAGTTVQEVNKLLAQFEKTQKVFKQIKKGGNNGLERLMGGIKNFNR